MPGGMDKKYTFRYSLTYQEAYDAFLALAMRYTKKVKYALMAGIVAVTVICMIMFIMDPERFYMFLMIIIAVLMTLYLFYMPVIKAKKGANMVARINGTYEVAITSTGKIILAGQEDDLKQDKNARAVELRDSFAIRPNSYTTVCIPKRTMRPSQVEAIREILQEYVKYTDYDDVNKNANVEE
ncbi:MAG: hypothetical protein KBS66_04700 [Eubacterium sp.]|nr:hypothetical protein [Candidatus Colimonas fimequi]